MIGVFVLWYTELLIMRRVIGGSTDYICIISGNLIVRGGIGRKSGFCIWSRPPSKISLFFLGFLFQEYVSIKKISFEYGKVFVIYRYCLALILIIQIHLISIILIRVLNYIIPSIYQRSRDEYNMDDHWNREGNNP